MQAGNCFNMYEIILLLPLLLPLVLLEESAQASSATRLYVYVGTYTTGESRGIYRYMFDSGDGSLKFLGIVAGVVNPSHLAIHATGRYLYTANEVERYEEQDSGYVTAFRIDPLSGNLRPINRQATNGSSPCYVTTDHSGRVLLVANYGGGSVSAFPIREDGSLGPISSLIQHTGSSVHPARQQGPHAHAIVPSPDNRFALAADLGLDQILVYRLNPQEATLLPNEPSSHSVKPGSGPRHLVFHPDGRHLYVVNELSNTVDVFSYRSDDADLTYLESHSTLPRGYRGRNSTAEILVDETGRFLYASNRGHNSLTVFQIEESGRIKPVSLHSTEGISPRNFRITPQGDYLLAANQRSNTVVVFKRDPNTGLLSRTQLLLTVPSPVCVRFLPLNQW
jgi:6-phosphogluconolactonase